MSFIRNIDIATYQCYYIKCCCKIRYFGTTKGFKYWNYSSVYYKSYCM